MPICDNVQTDDWKSEKHVPVIEAPDRVRPDEMFDVSVSLGKEVAHPNTTEHHIRWIRVFFKPDDDRSTYDLGNFEFSAHGESTEGPNEGPVHTHHGAAFRMRTKKAGTLQAMALCNIHGLWEHERRVELE